MSVERCKACGAILALVGYRHRCIPRAQPIASPPKKPAAKSPKKQAKKKR